jgi:hypothetical protein
MTATDLRMNWFGRNIKWFLPAIGLGTILSCLACIGMFVVLIFGTMKSSEPYQDALAILRSNSAAEQALGTPIRDGWYVTGSIGVSGSSGHAEFSFPVSGPKGSGTVTLIARRYGGRWTLTRLELTLNGSGRKIDLLENQ